MVSRNQPKTAQRRTDRIQTSSSFPAMSAPTAKANGTAHTAYPDSMVGGWYVIVGFCRSGLRPRPSGKAPSTRNCSNGSVVNSSTESKNRKMPHSVRMAYGMMARLRVPLKNTARALKLASWKVQNSIEPFWPPQKDAIW